MKARVCCTNEELSRVLTRDDLQWVIDRTPKKEVPTHAEAVFLQPFCVGLTADLGCGAEKVAPSVLGIDKLAYGERGQFGCMNGTPSGADISADGADLYFIAEGTLDSVVSRHAFEHLPDPMATLREWLRIIKKGGLLSLVCPDDRFQDFLNMDKDHKFRCYPNTVVDALESLNCYGGGAKGELVEVGRAVIPRWSFFAQIRRVEEGPAGAEPSSSPGGAVSLLRFVDPKKPVSGDWGLDQSLLSPGAVAGVAHRIEIPYFPGSEYDLSLTAELRADEGHFLVGLVGGGHHQFMLDIYSSVCGLTILDGKHYNQNETCARGQFIMKGKPTTLLFAVRRSGVVVTVNGKQTVDWKGDFKRFSVEGWKVGNGRSLFLGSGGAFQFTKILLNPLSGDSKPLR